MFLPSERLTLWHYFCHAEGYARPAAGAFDVVLVDGFGERHEPQDLWWPGAEVDWQRCFQCNAHSEAPGRGHIFARVRVCGEEIRVPSEADEGDDSRLSPHHAWFVEHGWRPMATLDRALRRLLAPVEVPMRFRELTGGRPGLPLQRALFYAGDGPATTMVEWPIGKQVDGQWCWPLEPYLDGDQVCNWFMESFMAGPRPWGHCDGWMVELLAVDLFGQAGGAAGPDNLAVRNPGRSGPTSRWVHVGKTKKAVSVTLHDLCEELGQHLPTLGMCDLKAAFPASARHPAEPAEELAPEMLLHADLRFTQGERLRVAEAVVTKQPLWWASSTLAPDLAAQSSASVALFQRDGTRDPPAPPRMRPRTAWDRSWATRSLSLEPGRVPSRPSSCPSQSSSQRWPEDGTSKEVPLAATLPHTRQLLLSSNGVRQFEFHPTRPGVMLAGRKDGVVAVLDHETDSQTHVLEVDSYPILGLSWLHTRPQWAVVGSSQSGTTCVVRYDESKPGCMEHVRLESFAHLSSLSVNCTDDFAMTSGFCVDLGLYDLVTGRRMQTFRGLHQNFINILRFAHRSPHVFATASFDHTCKVWDLREPVIAAKPVRLFNTDTLNVMCCFSQDDRWVLSSGVDAALQQFSLDKQQDVGTRFPLPALHSDTNYRRSLYMADGGLVATAATNESLVRMYTAEAPHQHRGHVDFKGMLVRRRQHAFQVGMNPYAQGGGGGAGSGGFSQALQAGPLVPAQPPRPPSATATAYPRQPEEYVQSLRCHPTEPSLLGALLSTSEPNPESYIAMMRLGR